MPKVPAVDERLGAQAPVGLVLGSEDATPLRYQVAVAPGEWLQLDDVVVTERTLPGGRVVRLAGLVTEIRARHEGTSFASDAFLVADGVLPAQTVEAAEVMTTRVEPELYVPPSPGTPVWRAAAGERDRALFFDRMDKRLPAGLARDGQPLFVNLEFLDGTRGAHVSISGISGVATKTTYATFLLYGLFTSGVLGDDALNTQALIFNVKGEDLLFLDLPNARLDHEQRARYAALGLEAGPFPSVAIYAPPRRDDPTGRPDVSARTDGVRAYWWTLAEFCAEELLPFVFADVEDERQQYTLVVQHLTTKLKREAVATGDDGAVVLDGTVLRTFEDLVDLICNRLDDDATAAAWAGRAVSPGTIGAFIRRFNAAKKPLGRLIRADLPVRGEHRAQTAGAQVTVVDLHTLPDRAKRFVVGTTIRREFDHKESRGAARPLLFLVLDELNKYAPREGTSPIKEILLDVAERGRSLGVILIGAQQTASEVERRIIANSAVRVAGRLDGAEAVRPEYAFLPEAHRKRATIAKPGTMFLAQPDLPVPLVVEFPFPAWATRPSEVVRTRPGTAAPSSGDPFEGLDA